MSHTSLASGRSKNNLGRNVKSVRNAIETLNLCAKTVSARLHLLQVSGAEKGVPVIQGTVKNENDMKITY